ncbi:hypothetical protein D1B31_16185 [Neobacillus notoginsengisoli]|uniref:Uncharacterized protein n=1 Tax=Neobacillus notoginsengisoli TaxID=1578198 RepID=A0A417YR22_9BACI|nr:hypothetical protein [Neobacillus notoginsengisoli]RHW37304.1 hypothetical protein D1B31_16185 [Neobacillus notoginsengisoli]
MEQLTLFKEETAKEKLDNKAFEWVKRCLRDTTPKDIPLPYRKILKATFIKAKKPTVTATLEMIDGYKARIEISRYSLFPDGSRWAGGGTAWTYRWLSSEGEGYLYWNREKRSWLREVFNF